jgi:predicted glycoside hydrolase/deacetylase ChbG (UPF0249 family)
MNARSLIVNADDFGQSHGVNQGIIEAHERGIVTSASLMVRWPAAATAAAYGRDHPRLSLGLHLDFGEWTLQDGAWVAVYAVVDASDPAAVAAEVARQVELFRGFAGRDPTHLDSHQHVHRREPAQSIAAGVARRLGIPLRHCSSGVRYCGSFYGQDDQGRSCPESISVAGLLRALERLSSGFTELACHPAFGDDLETLYRTERALELKTLCDPGVRAALDRLQIKLCSFADVADRSLHST